ncbi:hypothetical protein NVP1253O_13 [Vibrio phage 1.253.O._10N.286.45.B12]|nr:hypothetical protein NVP1253O_13 [Vibrio phage 1.253.O._10N.286.45.B12]
MADISHASLPDERLHQPKGAASAASDTWLRANGDGTTTFSSLPTSELQVVDSISSLSLASQQLASEGDEAQITFGTPETSASGSVAIGSDGSITFNESGIYSITLNRNVTRSANNSINTVAFSVRLNGTQVTETALASLDNADPGLGLGSSGTGILQATAGDVLTYHMLYLEGNAGTIGISPATVAATGWGNVPSAQVSISKLEV